jgi:hypothetical protein
MNTNIVRKRKASPQHPARHPVVLERLAVSADLVWWGWVSPEIAECANHFTRRADLYEDAGGWIELVMGVEAITERAITALKAAHIRDLEAFFGIVEREEGAR